MKNFILPLLCIGTFLAAGSASAQCKYVAIDAGKMITVDLPPGFPVAGAGIDENANRNDFGQAVALWQKGHPGSTAVDFTLPRSSGRFIEIPETELAKFTPAQQLAIHQAPYFYHITAKAN